jgi:hypothetical protein
MAYLIWVCVEALNIDPVVALENLLVFPEHHPFCEVFVSTYLSSVIRVTTDLRFLAIALL